MAGNYIASLLMKIGTDTGELERGLSKAKGNLNSFSNDAVKIGQTFTKALSFAGVGLGIAGVTSLLKSSIESVEGPGDRFAETMAGGKESLFEFQRAMGSLDFTHLLTNLKEGFERGKELDEALDALEDRKGYSDYVIIGLQQEAEALRETTKNKQLDLATRSKAADDLAKIEEKILKRKKEIIQETYDVEKLSWEGRNKMTIDEGVKLFEDMNNITKNGYKGIKVETINQMKDLYDSYVESERLLGGSVDKITKGGASLLKSNLLGMGNYDFIKDIPKEDLEFLADTFQKFTLLNETGESGVWVKLFETVNKNTKANVDAQKEYNGAIGETSKLLAQDEKNQVSITKEIQKQSDIKNMEASKSNSLGKVSTSNLSIPALGTPFQLDNTLAVPPVIPELDPALEYENALQSIIDRSFLLASLPDPFEFMNESITKFSNTLGDGASSFKEYGKSIIATIRDIVSAYLGQVIAEQIVNSMKLAKLSGPAAVIVAPILAAAAAGGMKTLFNSLIPGFANGTDYAPPGLAWVGERGKELVNLPAGSQVIPNIQARGMMNGKTELLARVEGREFLVLLRNAQDEVNSYA